MGIGSREESFNFGKSFLAHPCAPSLFEFVVVACCFDVSSHHWHIVSIGFLGKKPGCVCTMHPAVLVESWVSANDQLVSFALR